MCINNSVIDLTAQQHAATFDGEISKVSLVIATYNNAYRLVGFKEDTTIQLYLNKFSGHVEIGVEEWLGYHIEQAFNFIKRVRLT